ncbi:hypothetical protein OVS_03320 [Mycoplasma ovis str. Michigan]|uniref:Uncharacterized protein n=1 Tax=Mycoplasma ovis str. Michigan TaxID=1415773 RepID=A0ABM5P1Q3_9MOLU|nr:hypothetical protein OVS_03320 [Mycoplasma ovis str. Michigan]
MVFAPLGGELLLYCGQDLEKRRYPLSPPALILSQNQTLIKIVPVYLLIYCQRTILKPEKTSSPPNQFYLWTNYVFKNNSF